MGTGRDRTLTDAGLLRIDPVRYICFALREHVTITRKGEGTGSRFIAVCSVCNKRLTVNVGRGFFFHLLRCDTC